MPEFPLQGRRALRLALLFALAAGPALAQQNATVYLTQAGSDATIPVQLGDSEALTAPLVDRFLDSPLDLSSLGLTGLTNGVLLAQLGVGNAATLQQQGQRNSAFVVEDGNGNTVSLSQLGDGNVYGAVLVGDGNTTTAVQDGDGNRYGLYFEGSDLSHSVLQQGNGNEAFQVGASSSRPADVVQIGDGLQLLIEHN